LRGNGIEKEEAMKAIHPVLLLCMICGTGTVLAQIPGVPGVPSAPSTPSIPGVPGVPSTPSVPGASGVPGMSGMMGGGLPDVSKLGVGNATGLLSYCMKNKILGGSDATSVLGGLTQKPDVTSSKDFGLGQSGTMSTGQGSTLSMDSLPGPAKTQVCNMVLKQAKGFL
jgi:hypothetical protein